MAGEIGSTKTGSQYVVHDVETGPSASGSGSGSQQDPDLGGIVTQHEHRSLVRGLGQRHIQMIAIAGAIVCDHNLKIKSFANFS